MYFEHSLNFGSVFLPEPNFFPLGPGYHMWDRICFTWQGFGSGVGCRADICENIPEAFLKSNKASSNWLQMVFPKFNLFCPWTVTGELFLPVFQPFVKFSLLVQLGKGSYSSCSGLLTLSQGQPTTGILFQVLWSVCSSPLNSSW